MATSASSTVLRVASGNPFRLNQRMASVMSFSFSSRGWKLERGTFEPGIGLSTSTWTLNSS